MGQMNQSLFVFLVLLFCGEDGVGFSCEVYLSSSLFLSTMMKVRLDLVSRVFT